MADDGDGVNDLDDRNDGLCNEVDGFPGRGGSRTAGETPETNPVPETTPMIIATPVMATHPTGNTEPGFLKHRKTVGRLIGAFKTVSTKHINIMRETPGATRVRAIWQRDFYEQIIRNNHQYQRIAEYIMNNPRR